MRKLLIILAIGGILNMAAIANTFKGFLPGRIDKQTVTQEPGSFGTYKEESSEVLNKRTGEPYMNTSFVKAFNDSPFDIEKASEMPIRPTLKFTLKQQVDNLSHAMDGTRDDRPFLKDTQGKNTRYFKMSLPQDTQIDYSTY